MDFTTIIGIIVGLLALVGGYAIEGGSISGLMVGTAALIVFGGTIGAVIVSFPKRKLKKIPEALRTAFREPKQENSALIAEIVDMATVARREGVLALEQRVQEHPNDFLRNGLLMVVDGTDPELTRQILELEIDAIEEHYEDQAKIFESAGGYAPTMGIIGTVLGLINVLSNMSEDPSGLGAHIAVAFSATLYGVASANVIYLPIANKIKVQAKERVQEMELMLEGILAVQAGENPQLIMKKMTSFILKDKKSGNAAEEEDAQEK